MDRQAAATVDDALVLHCAPAFRSAKYARMPHVWDLADRQSSRWVVPLGAAGPDGPHQQA